MFEIIELFALCGIFAFVIYQFVYNIIITFNKKG